MRRFLDRRIATKDTSELDWPVWVPVLAGILPIAAAANALVHRDALFPPGWETLAALIAIFPWLADLTGALLGARHSFPRWLFSIIVMLGIGVLVWFPPGTDVAPTVLVFLVAEMAARMRRSGGIAVYLGCVGVMVAADLFGNYDGIAPWVMGFTFALFGGSALQSQLRLTSELKEAQSDLANKAASDERARIAREVHDVIAHSLSVTMLHITAARMALERGQSARALDALREAEQQGRNSLSDVRRTVGLLGSDESADAAPMPTAADLRKLIADFRTAGLDVDFAVDGDVNGLPAAAGLNLYRIVQESLTNVVKHAPGAKADIDLSIGESGIRLRVRNDNVNGATLERADGGLGLRGMVERAALLGGSLETETNGAGWTVTLVAPPPEPSLSSE